ncbi:MAG: hypothetical protein QUS09_10050 [Methanotrichaceae archaeon]|nr:hypothetical protein [Methanotrichaceae archaeon]
MSSVTGLEEVKEMARSEGLEATEIAIDRCFFEQLYVIKLEIAHGLS